MKIVLFLSVVVLAAAAPKKYKVVLPNFDLIDHAKKVKHMDQISKIVGGSNADIRDYPWQVSLRSSNSHICGASIINSKWVVSAAHCTQGSRYSIRAGSTNRLSGGQVRSVIRVINHEDYNDGSGTFANDISLLELSEELSFNDAVQPISLPSSGQSFTGDDCVLSGWGRTSGSGSLPSTLQHVTMPVISNNDCSRGMSNVNGANIISSHICVSSNQIEASCNGDSGGPMTCYGNDGTPYLAGATSWGVSNCPGTFPSVYTRISSFLSWIKNNVQN